MLITNDTHRGGDTDHPLKARLFDWEGAKILPKNNAGSAIYPPPLKENLANML